VSKGQKPMRGQPNPGIAQPRPPRPKISPRYERSPADKYEGPEDEERFMRGKEPTSNITPMSGDEMEMPDIRRKFRERRRMNDGPEDRMPMATPPPRRTPPPSRSPMGQPTPRPAPGPMPTPTEPGKQDQRQSRLRKAMMRRRQA